MALDGIAVSSGDADEVLTPEEAARLLKLSKKTLLRLARDGSIPGSKVGRGWRFRRSQLLSLLDSRGAE